MYGHVRVSGPEFKEVSDADDVLDGPIRMNTELYNLFCSLLGYRIYSYIKSFMRIVIHIPQMNLVCCQTTISYSTPLHLLCCPSCHNKYNKLSSLLYCNSRLVSSFFTHGYLLCIINYIIWKLLSHLWFGIWSLIHLFILLPCLLY